MLAIQNVEATIPVSDKLAKGNHRYFLLRVSGNSMNRAGIRNGDLALVRQQSTAEPGQNVVALIDDEATVKRLRLTPDAIVLEPVSTDPKFRPIILDREFAIQGVVVGTIPAA
jgi:repressor LexA